MHIYVISVNENGPVKIGSSKNPNRRLKQLQTANCSSLILYYQTEITYDLNIKKLEKLIHKDINYLRTKGEWFNINVNKAISVIEHAMIRYYEELEN